MDEKRVAHLQRTLLKLNIYINSEEEVDYSRNCKKFEGLDFECIGTRWNMIRIGFECSRT